MQVDAEHQHDQRVTSVGIEEEGCMDMRKLNAWLQKLLSEKGNDIFRSKGILCIQGSDEKWVGSILPAGFPCLGSCYCGHCDVM